MLDVAGRLPFTLVAAAVVLAHAAVIATKNQKCHPLVDMFS